MCNVQDLDGRLEKSNIVGIDFGCSCFATAGQSLMEVVGSPMYLAPEAVAVSLDFISDLASSLTIVDKALIASCMCTSPSMVF